MLLASLSSSFTAQVANHGVYAVFGLLALGAVLPAASEVVMLYAGAVAAGVFAAANGVSVFGWHVAFGGGALVVLAVAASLGYLTGALVGWGIGRHGGRPLLEQRGRWLHATPERLDRAEAWFGRWGAPGVLIGTMLPVVRSFVAIPSGIFEMPVGPFALLTLTGGTIWAFAFGGAGYALGTGWERFDHGFRYAEYAIAAGLVLVVAYLVYRWRAAGGDAAGNVRRAPGPRSRGALRRPRSRP